MFVDCWLSFAFEKVKILYVPLQFYPLLIICIILIIIIKSLWNQFTMIIIFFLQCLNNVPTIYYIPSGQSPSLTQHFFFSWSKSCFTWICHNEEKKRQSRSFCLIPTLGLLLCWYQCYWSESERALLLVLSSWKIMSSVLKILNNIFQ